MNPVAPPFLSSARLGQPPETPPPDPMAALRRTRRHDHLAAALATPDPLRAVLGEVTNNLLEVADAYHANLTSNLAGLAAPDTLREVRPTLDSYLRLVRQIDRFAQFEFRARQMEQAAAARATVAAAANAAASEENAL